MKSFLLIGSIFFSQLSFAHEVSFPLYTSLDKALVTEKCSQLGEMVKNRLAVEVPQASSRMKVVVERAYMPDNVYVDSYVCTALFNNLPGEVTIKTSVATQNKYDRDTQSCPQDVDSAKTSFPRWIAIVEKISKPIFGKAKCKVEVLEAVDTQLN